MGLRRPEYVGTGASGLVSRSGCFMECVIGSVAESFTLRLESVEVSIFFVCTEVAIPSCGSIGSNAVMSRLILLEENGYVPSCNIY